MRAERFDRGDGRVLWIGWREDQLVVILEQRRDGTFFPLTGDWPDVEELAHLLRAQGIEWARPS